jgi:hypothetical protein
VTKADELVERGAAFLEQLSHKASSEGGLVAKLAEPLAEEADFLRKLKPSLVLARLRGKASTDGKVELDDTVERPHPQPDPQPDPQPKPEKPKKSGGGPNPIVVVAAAFAVGVVVAKMVDWRGSAHPRF